MTSISASLFGNALLASFTVLNPLNGPQGPDLADQQTAQLTVDKPTTLGAAIQSRRGALKSVSHRDLQQWSHVVLNAIEAGLSGHMLSAHQGRLFVHDFDGIRMAANDSAQADSLLNMLDRLREKIAGAARRNSRDILRMFLKG